MVYSTHSPYLIPNDWESVHFVTMTNSGTTLTQENKYDLLKQSAYHPTLDHIRPLSAGGCGFCTVKAISKGISAYCTELLRRSILFHSHNKRKIFPMSTLIFP